MQRNMDKYLELAEVVYFTICANGILCILIYYWLLTTLRIHDRKTFMGEPELFVSMITRAIWTTRSHAG